MHGSAAAGFGDGKFPISENQTSRPSPVLGESGEPLEASRREEERKDEELLRHPTQVSGEEPAGEIIYKFGHRFVDWFIFVIIIINV